MIFKPYYDFETGCAAYHFSGSACGAEKRWNLLRVNQARQETSP
jgi:hypothetical protein